MASIIDSDLTLQSATVVTDLQYKYNNPDYLDILTNLIPPENHMCLVCFCVSSLHCGNL